MTIPDSAVNARQGNMSALAGSHSAGVPAGALTVFLRMLWADSRSETSPQRVGCGISRHHSGKNARSARQRAGRRALSPVLEQILSSGFLIEPVRSGFPKKRSLRGLAGFETPEIGRKLRWIIFLLPRRLLFLARFRFERRNPRLERTTFSLHVTGSYGGG